MPYFTKRPEVFEARQWDGTGENALELFHWMDGAMHLDRVASRILFTALSEGLQTIWPLDWIVKESSGHISVYSEEDFPQRFDLAVEEDPDEDICECGNTFCMEDHTESAGSRQKGEV